MKKFLIIVLLAFAGKMSYAQTSHISYYSTNSYHSIYPELINTNQVDANNAPIYYMVSQYDSYLAPPGVTVTWAACTITYYDDFGGGQLDNENPNGGISDIWFSNLGWSHVTYVWEIMLSDNSYERYEDDVY